MLPLPARVSRDAPGLVAESEYPPGPPPSVGWAPLVAATRPSSAARLRDAHALLAQRDAEVDRLTVELIKLAAVNGRLSTRLSNSLATQRGILPFYTPDPLAGAAAITLPGYAGADVSGAPVVAVDVEGAWEAGVLHALSIFAGVSKPAGSQAVALRPSAATTQLPLLPTPPIVYLLLRRHGDVAAIAAAGTERAVGVAGVPSVFPLPRDGLHLDSGAFASLSRDVCKLPGFFAPLLMARCLLAGSPLTSLLRDREKGVSSRSRDSNASSHSLTVSIVTSLLSAPSPSSSISSASRSMLSARSLASPGSGSAGGGSTRWDDGAAERATGELTSVGALVGFEHAVLDAPAFFQFWGKTLATLAQHQVAVAATSEVDGGDDAAGTGGNGSGAMTASTLQGIVSIWRCVCEPGHANIRPEDLRPLLHALMDSHADYAATVGNARLREQCIVALLCSLFCSLGGHRSPRISFAQLKSSK